jgi:hypothetical protein
MSGSGTQLPRELDLATASVRKLPTGRDLAASISQGTMRQMMHVAGERIDWEEKMYSRLLLIAFAYLVASLMGSVAASPVVETFSRVLELIFVVFIICAGYGVLPAFVIVGLSEVYSLRSPIYFAGTWPVVPFIGVFLMDRSLQLPPIRIVVASVIYGVVAGLVYWFIAGRTAGMRKHKLAS